MNISIIVVSYNVKYLLTGLLHSLQKALFNKFDYEIIIVDNNSLDNSPEFINGKFENLKIIKNKENLGFAVANNQGLNIATGEYVLLINPDTLVQEDIFDILIEFLKENSEFGGATAKMLNPDGSFAIDCRHGIPTPRDAFYKATGLTKIFPGSRHFSYYHQTFLDENKENDIPALSGAFMFFKKETIKDVGFLDESFFMYCEDIDYCYRMAKKNWKIRYLPDTRIIHFKGESTKEKNYNYVKNFNLSMLQFFKKHYASRYSGLLYILIRLGVYFRGILLLLKEKIFSNLLGISKKTEQNHLYIRTKSEITYLEFLNKNKDKCYMYDFELSNNSIEYQIEAIKSYIKMKTINKITFDISIGYKFIFEVMENIFNFETEFAFFYPEWKMIVEKGGGELLKSRSLKSSE